MATRRASRLQGVDSLSDTRESWDHRHDEAAGATLHTIGLEGPGRFAGTDRGLACSVGHLPLSQVPAGPSAERGDLGSRGWAAALHLL